MSEDNLTPDGKPKARLLNLSGEHDERIAQQLGMTVRELVATRRESVRVFREVLASQGDMLEGMDDDAVYGLMSQVQQQQMQQSILQGFADLSSLSEDERIETVGKFSLANPGKKIGLPTDNVPGKPERYKQKLEAQFPTLTVVIAAREGSIAVLHITAPTGTN